MNGNACDAHITEEQREEMTRRLDERRRADMFDMDRDVRLAELEQERIDRERALEGYAVRRVLLNSDMFNPGRF